MTEYYVSDGGNNGNTGLSHAQAWLTLQYGFDNMPNTAGNRLNINGSFTLSAEIDLTTFGNTNEPVRFQGYTSTAGDGGVADIDCATFQFIDTAYNAMHFRHLKFTNWGSVECIDVQDYNSIIECEFDGEGARARAATLGTGGVFAHNKVHDMAGSGTTAIVSVFTGWCRGNYIQTTGGRALSNNVTNTIANVISMDSTDSNAVGIYMQGDELVCEGNTVFNQAAGTGTGISWLAADMFTLVVNNIICGFSGTGGVGYGSTGSHEGIFGYNKFFNNETNVSVSGNPRRFIDLGNNDTLLANPFKSTGNADPNDDDFELSTGITGWPGQLWDPDGTFGTRNQHFISVGALQEAP